jgi:hypothetical protein
MPRVSKAFFTVAALCGLAGIFWGMHMGKSGDHTMHAVHAHLNLLGWVTLSIMGGFYALPGSPKGGWLPWTNLVLSAAGAIWMSILLPQVIGGKVTGALMVTAEVPVVLGMVLFIAAIVLTWRSKPAAS